MDDSLEMVPLWSSGMVHEPLMQVHNYHRFGRRFSVNDPDAHSSVLDYMHCHLIDDDYVVVVVAVCDVSRSVILIWIDVLDDDVARIGAFVAVAAVHDDADDGGGDDDAFVVVSLH